MAKENIIKTIHSQIERYIKEDFSTLYIENPNVIKWNNADKKDIEEMIDESIEILKEVLKKELLKDLTIPMLTNLNNYFTNFFNQYAQIKNLQPNQLRNQHHNPLNQINGINNLLRSYGIYSLVKLGPDIVEKAELLDKQTIEVNVIQEKVNKLLTQVESLISPSVAHSLSNSFENRKKSIVKQKWIWFVVMVVAFIIAIWITSDITHTIAELIESGKTKDIENGANEQTVTLFTLVLRLIILFPSYYIVFFTISQYRKERKLEEIYAHKSAVAQTLPSYSELVGNLDVKDSITSHATNVVFELPEKEINNEEKEGKNKLYNLTEIKELLNSLTSIFKNINSH